MCWLAGFLCHHKNLAKRVANAFNVVGNLIVIINTAFIEDVNYATGIDNVIRCI